MLLFGCFWLVELLFVVWICCFDLWWALLANCLGFCWLCWNLWVVLYNVGRVLNFNFWVGLFNVFWFEIFGFVFTLIVPYLFWMGDVLVCGFLLVVFDCVFWLLFGLSWLLWVLGLYLVICLFWCFDLLRLRFCFDWLIGVLCGFILFDCLLMFVLDTLVYVWIGNYGCFVVFVFKWFFKFNWMLWLGGWFSVLCFYFVCFDVGLLCYFVFC